MFCAAALVMVGAGCPSDKTEDNPYEDTIGPMTSVEGPEDGFQMDLEVENSVGKDGVGSDARKGITEEHSLSYPTQYAPPNLELVEPVMAIVDEDKDGADDTTDNCLGWVNPDQLDTDHDGLGDTCDATPYGEGTVDYDHDGITDLSDNCPEVYNPDQGEC